MTKILTKNYKNIMNGNTTQPSGTYSVLLNAPIKDTSGTEYSYSSLYVSPSNTELWTRIGMTLGSGCCGRVRRKTSSLTSSDCSKLYYDIGTVENPGENTYNITSTTATCSAVAVDGSDFHSIYTVTNNTANNIIVNCIAAFNVMSGDTSSTAVDANYKNVLISIYVFDPITIEPGHAISIEGKFA